MILVSITVFYSEPTPTPTTTPTNTQTPTVTASQTVTPTYTATGTVTPTNTATVTPTPTITPSTTPSLEDLTDGFNVTIANHIEVIFANPATTLATGTFVLPSNPCDKQVIEVLTSKQISTLTVLPNVGQSMVTNPPTIMLAGSGFSYRYCAIISTWFRRW